MNDTVPVQVHVPARLHSYDDPNHFRTRAGAAQELAKAHTARSDHDNHALCQ